MIKSPIRTTWGFTGPKLSVSALQKHKLLSPMLAQEKPMVTLNTLKVKIARRGQLCPSIPKITAKTCLKSLASDLAFMFA